MRKENKIRRREEFGRVYRQGKSYANKYLVLYVLPNRLGRTRFGFSVGKQLGGAVERNQLRRRLREICRQHLDGIKPGYDLVVITRKAAKDTEFATLQRAMRHLFHKSGMFSQE